MANTSGPQPDIFFPPSKPPEISNGITTLWMPMTATWPIHPKCTDNFFEIVEGTTVAYDPWLKTLAGLTCLPPQATPYWDQPNIYLATLAPTVVTSLGPIACPSQYTTASTSEKNWESTIVFCCPSGFDFLQSVAPGGLGQCTATPDASKTATVHFYNQKGKFPAMTTAHGVDSSLEGVGVNGWVFNSVSPTATETTTPTTMEPTTAGAPRTATLLPVSDQAHSTPLPTSTSQPESYSGTSKYTVVGSILGGFAIVMIVGTALFLCRWINWFGWFDKKKAAGSPAQSERGVELPDRNTRSEDAQ